MDAGSSAQALMGGALLGASTSLLLVLEGRSEGVSGMAGRVFTGTPRERAARLAFLLALAATGLACRTLSVGAFASTSPRPLGVVLVAGLLVGFGARLANGCTSGHGIGGVARTARRSIVATAIFCASAAAVVALYPPGAS